MDKKVRSKPMIQILDRLRAYGEFEIIIFGNDLILSDAPVETWPVCDCLISFFSTGFPLHKAIEYVKLRKPFVVNDLQRQKILNNRMEIYKCLDEHNIPTPRHLYAIREPGYPPPVVVQTEDYIEINGQKMFYPIVEKPLAADDHNIRVYYGKKYGGGSRRLFRKVGNRSSRFYPNANKIRTKGSFIYEELLRNGKDLKVYTIGPGYAHGEMRKSPVVDGIVERNPDNKELRLLTKLTEEEKKIAAQVVLVFNQNICGFDIIRWLPNAAPLLCFSLPRPAVYYGKKWGRLRCLCH